MKVIIESAMPLDQESKASLEKVLSKVREDLEFVYTVNTHVLGGLRVTIGSKRIDLSLSGKLSQLRRHLA